VTADVSPKTIVSTAAAGDLVLQGMLVVGHVVDAAYTPIAAATSGGARGYRRRQQHDPN